MPVTNKSATVDSKMHHFVSRDAIVADDTAAAVFSGLYDAARAIIIEWIGEETIEVHETGAPCTYKVGNSSSATAYGTVVGLADDSIGDIITARPTVRRVPAGTHVLLNHTDTGTKTGQAFIHIWYYFEDQSAATEVP